MPDFTICWRAPGGAETLALLGAHAGAATDCALADVALDKPLAAWGKGFCVGVNYPERNEDIRMVRTGRAIPAYSSAFPIPSPDPSSRWFVRPRARNSITRARSSS